MLQAQLNLVIMALLFRFSDGRLTRGSYDLKS
jgi:hypothetical protein